MITKRFIEEQVYGPATFSFGTYELHRNSPVNRYPDKHNIVIRDSHNPLSSVLAYAPKPIHAIQVKMELQEKLRKLTHFHYAKLSLNAHTIIFLSKAGIAALSNLYRSSPRVLSKWNGTFIHAILTPISNQYIKSFNRLKETLPDQKQSNDHTEDQFEKITILYDYILDCSVEISDLTISVLKRLSDEMTLNDIIDEFEKQLDSEEAKAQLRYTLIRIVKILYEKGFICNELSYQFV